MTNKLSNLRLISRLLLAIVTYSLVFFGSAGTLNWAEGWLFILIYFIWGVPLIFWLRKNDPELLIDRMTFMPKSTKTWDKIFIYSTIPIFLVLFLLPGIDAIRYGWSSVPFIWKFLGFIGVISSLLLITVVMKENTFLSRVVEVQKDKGHKVVDTGPYAIVRHPMYVGVILLVLSMPLALGSFYTFIPAVITTIAIMIRTVLEEKTLEKELNGYCEYEIKVRYRLLPWIW